MLTPTNEKIIRAMLRPKDMLVISHHLHVASVYYGLAADQFRTALELEIAKKHFARAKAIIEESENGESGEASKEKPNDDERGRGSRLDRGEHLAEC